MIEVERLKKWFLRNIGRYREIDAAQANGFKNSRNSSLIPCGKVR